MPTTCHAHPDAHEDALIALVARTPWLMAALEAARSLGLPAWCIGAGALRTLVWDHLHGFAPHASAAALPDVDLVYFDADAPGPEAEQAIQARLAALLPDVPWEVTNQAGVHMWFARRFGHAIAPFSSLEAGIASWPELATCVGVTLMADGRLRVLAPFGLRDLFAMRVQRNAQVSEETFRRRVAEKRFAERWPRVQVL